MSSVLIDAAAAAGVSVGVVALKASGKRQLQTSVKISVGGEIVVRAVTAIIDAGGNADDGLHGAYTPSHPQQVTVATGPKILANALDLGNCGALLLKYCRSWRSGNTNVTVIVRILYSGPRSTYFVNDSVITTLPLLIWKISTLFWLVADASPRVANPVNVPSLGPQVVAVTLTS